MRRRETSQGGPPGRGDGRYAAAGGCRAADIGANAEGTAKVVAAIDLGTNNCRLMTARWEGAHFRVIDMFSRMVRLGQGLAATGQLSEAAMTRTLAALGEFVGRMRARRVGRWRAVATEACRRAGNCDSFLARVVEETGLTVEIIAPEEEARLALAGCGSLLDPARRYALMFDIGGGSTEIMWIERNDAATGAGAWTLVDCVSLSYGVVGLAERFGADPCAGDFAAIKREVTEILLPFDRRHAIAEKVAAGTVQMLGTSGTVTTIAGVHLDLERYSRKRVDGFELDFHSVGSINRRLGAMGCAERAAHPCIGQARADLVVGGCAVLDALCDLWPVGRLTVADRGVRDGIVLGLMRGETAGIALSQRS